MRIAPRSLPRWTTPDGWMPEKIRGLARRSPRAARGQGPASVVMARECSRRRSPGGRSRRGRLPFGPMSRPARHPVMSGARLRVGVLGAGTVGREVVARAARPARRAARRPMAPRSSWPPSAVRDAGRATAAGIPAELLSDAPAHLVADDEHRRHRRADGRRRAGPHADRGGAVDGQERRHRQQARHRPSRAGARGDRPADRGGAPLRGGGRWRDPGPRAARGRPRRATASSASAASSTARPTSS